MTAEFEDPLAALRALRTTGDDAGAEASTEKKETA
jgi:hypothetical protein